MKHKLKKGFKNIFLSNTFIYCVLVAFFFILILKASQSLDPDFGWHLRMGNLILSEGIPQTDPFSYTMPSYPFVDHEWLTNVVIAKTYPLIDFFGLSVIAAIILFLSLSISIGNNFGRKILKQYRSLSLLAIIFFLSLTCVSSFFGVRPQVQSWLFLAILLKIIMNEAIWRKWKFFLPLLFLIWVNLHGSFAAGIVTLFFVLIIRSFRKRKTKVDYILISITSLIATLINPYGYGAWWETWQQISDTSLRWTIVEWMPSFMFFNPSFCFLIALSILIVIKYRKKFYLEEKGLYFIFLIQALGTSRHVPLWVMISIPITLIGINFLYHDLKKIRYGISRLEKVGKYGFVVVVLITLVNLIPELFFPPALKESDFYPGGAVEFLTNNLPKGNIFSSYNWGGYLIWKLPQKKVYIDGRMPSWRWKENPPNESSYAMKDYEKLLNGETSYKGEFEKYSIDTVLFSVEREKTFWQKLDEKLMPLLEKFGIKKSKFLLFDELKKDGWIEIYRDNIAAIYQKE